MIEDSWPAVEVLLTRWIRESTGLEGTKVHWPINGLPRPESPCATLSVLSERQLGKAGGGKRRTSQPTAWTVTLGEGPGLHSIDLLVQGEAELAATTSITAPEDATIEEARDALLAQALTDFDGLVVVAVSGDEAVTVTGAVDLTYPVFHVDVEAIDSVTLTQGPEQVVRSTPTEITVSIEFRSPATTGASSARALAWSARNGIDDFRALLNRCGWEFGPFTGDRPGYAEDLTETRHVLDVVLTGHVLDVRPVRPFLRKLRAELSTPTGSTTIDAG